MIGILLMHTHINRKEVLVVPALSLFEDTVKSVYYLWQKHNLYDWPMAAEAQFLQVLRT